jgi:hypothetical protein
MDRQITYPGQLLTETSLLQATKDAMIGMAKLSSAVLGTANIASGFAVTPTGPASLQVVCAAGEIYSMTTIDALAFSSLPADTTHSILKQGIMLDGVTFSCPAPGTPGQSINYLIQVTYQDTDSTPVLLPYYNSANPALPFSGMGNNGLPQNTIRKGSAIVAVKAGASAATNSQVTPSPDAGYVGLYVVTVAFGQTTITAGSIAQYGSAPLLPSGIVQAAQTDAMRYAVDIGSANAYVAVYSPAITAIKDGMTLKFRAVNANTGSSTFSPNGFTPLPIVGAAHTSLQGGEIVASGDVWVQYNSVLGGWVLIDSTGGGLQVSPASRSQHAAQISQVQSNAANYAVDGGIVNAVAVNLSPIPTVLTDGMLIYFKPKFTNTGATTISVNGLTAIPLVGQALSALQGGELLASGRAIGIYSSTSNVVQLLMCTGGGLQVGAALQSSHAAQLSQIGHGQCRLSVNSATQLKLAPYNGNNMIINGVPQPIPGAGITISNGSLAASTLYYVYVFMSSGTMTLELSTTGHSTGTTGIEQKTGDATRTLVGMIYTNASSQFVDLSTQRFCLNWFNRRSIQVINTFAANRSTTSASFVELSSAERAQFLNWGDEGILVSITGYASQNTVGTFGTQGTLDGITPISNARISPPVGQDSACGSSGPASPSEGFHYATIFGFATAGFTATWTVGINSINVAIRG